MKILGFDSQVFLAPMAGITDYPLRSLVASMGPGVLVSEMVAVNALQRQNHKTCRIADVRREPYPVVVQLVGSDAELFVEAAKLAEELGAYSLDINMGCPVKKIVGSGSGAALMKDLPKAAGIIRAVAAATPLKVSVKFRKGWDNNCINAVEFAQMCEDNGASYITIHGRTRSEFYSGKADWDIIAAVKNAVKIPVIGNGDVTSPQKAQALLDYTGADGVMIGRAALGAPWLISAAHDYINNQILRDIPSVREIKNILLKHIDGLVNYYGTELALPLSRKYVCWYCRNLRDAKKFREKYVKINNYPEALQAIDEYFDNCSKEENK